MIQLRTLGVVDLRGPDGQELRSILVQPKRLALLLYLALAAPRGFHRRDRLVALFWPELDGPRARNALSQSLYILRRGLGEGVLINRGDEEVGLAEGVLACDVMAFEAALAQRSLAEALEWYRGDLLEGFFPGDVEPEFEHWLDEERAHLKQLALQAALTLTAEEEARENLPLAQQWARRALVLSPSDEVALQRNLEILLRQGDRSGAVRAYEEFARRIKEDYELEPSPELRALMAAVRIPSEERPLPPLAAEGEARAHSPAHPAEPEQIPLRREQYPKGKGSVLTSPLARRSGWLHGSLSIQRLSSVWQVVLAVVLVAMAAGVAWVGRDPRVLAAVSADSGAPVGPERPDAETASIAVLPFANLSESRESEYFSDGLTEELLNTLAQVEGLKVAARTSSFSFKGQNLPVNDIARQLGVSAVVEGSVRRAGDRLRITVKLINASDGYHVWSHTYERDLADVFEIQEDISQAVVRNLLPRLSRTPGQRLVRQTTANLVAHEFYLRARHQLRNAWTESELRAAIELLKQAIEEDNGYALAYAGLADAYIRLGFQGVLPPAETFGPAIAYAQRAIDLDSELAEAYALIAYPMYVYQWDWKGAEEAFRRSMELNPLLAEACLCYALYLANMGRGEEAIREAERGQHLDPVSPISRERLAWVYYLAGRPEEAERRLARVFEIDPQSRQGHWLAAVMLRDRGDLAGALEQLERIRNPQDYALVLAELGYTYALLGRPAEAQRALEQLKARKYVPPEAVAAIHLGLGDTDEAMRWLQRAYTERSNLVEFNARSISRPLRTDPRYLRLIESIGLR